MSNSPTPSLAKNGKEDFHHVEELTSPDSHINVGNDYANNVNAKIRNPLLGISKPDLLAQVTEFCREHDLEDKTYVFQKGALVAQHPESFEDIEELDEGDKVPIRQEKSHKWRLPWTLYYTVAICSLGSAIQGWDNTGANGANLSFPQEFGIEHNTWLVGFVNAAPGISGLMSTWVADPMNNWVGRRGVIFITGLFGFCSNLVFYRIGPLAWRFQLAAAFAPAVPIVILIWFCPESPRWLLKKHRYKDSFRSFCRLRNSEVIAARDLYYAHCQFVEEEEAFKGTTLAQRAKEIFTIPRIRRANLGGAIVMMAQQFSGINIMAFYSSTIFKEAGSNTLETLLSSFGFGLVNFIFAFPAIWTIDTFGRRNLLLFTFPNMAWCLIAAGCCFLIPAENNARLPLIAFFIYLFTALYSPGIGPVPNVYASECFPLSHREIGVAFSVFINNTLSSILGLTFPSILSGMGPTGAFCFYAGLNMVAFVIIFFFLPETKQRTLEELDYIFGVPTRRHAAYQTRTWLPWFIKRYILFQSKARLEPLYHLEGFSGGTTVEVMAIH
ncbi:hypothetical protein V500_06819 [Pseudogymnoascus sp. VKM F-4518 (FW-2643)]|nr:hypothetical protein V500_06819 [Pseudogymnoascus sp. VKM F-4518 (FW-2643)]